MKINILSLIFLITFVSSCGFKAVDQNYLKDYKLVNLSIEGDQKFNLVLKNKLNSISNIAGSNLIALEISTKKIKSIKEKNIKNQIAKYKIEIVADVKYVLVDKDKNGSFKIKRIGSYSVGDKHTQTLNNEKKLIKNLSSEVSKQIQKSLIIAINDL